MMRIKEELGVQVRMDMAAGDSSTPRCASAGTVYIQGTDTVGGTVIVG